MTIVLLLVLLSVTVVSSKSITGVVGQNITLTCKYNPKKDGVSHMCWGRGELPNSGCNNVLISTDGNKVNKETSGRFQLLGQLKKGDVSLTILNLTESDAGSYGCRVQISGWFNDKKLHYDLTVEEDSHTTTGTRTYNETTAGPTSSHSTGQLMTTEKAYTSSSSIMKTEQQDSSSLTVALLLVLCVVITLITAGGILFIMRPWRRLNKVPQQQEFSATLSTLQLHRRESAVDNIYQIDIEDGGEYAYCP